MPCSCVPECKCWTHSSSRSSRKWRIPWAGRWHLSCQDLCRYAEMLQESGSGQRWAQPQTHRRGTGLPPHGEGRGSPWGPECGHWEPVWLPWAFLRELCWGNSWPRFASSLTGLFSAPCAVFVKSIAYVWARLCFKVGDTGFCSGKTIRLKYLAFSLLNCGVHMYPCVQNLCSRTVLYYI